jgi:hypothetical protein
MRAIQTTRSSGIFLFKLHIAGRYYLVPKKSLWNSSHFWRVASVIRGSKDTSSLLVKQCHWYRHIKGHMDSNVRAYEVYNTARLSTAPIACCIWTSMASIILTAWFIALQIYSLRLCHSKNSSRHYLDWPHQQNTWLRGLFGSITFSICPKVQLSGHYVQTL